MPTNPKDERAEAVVSIEPSQLRTEASPVALDRVWSRLEGNLDGASRRRASFVGRGPAWGIALAAATFGAGIWVGRVSVPPNQHLEARVSAEPQRASGQMSPGRPLADHRAEHEQPLPVIPVPSQESGPLPIARKRPSPLASADGPLPDASASSLLAPENGVVTAEPAPAPDVGQPVQVLPEPPPWQRLANGGEYEAALFELSQVGGFETALERSSAEQLMLLVDVARATGQRQRAIAALRRVVEKYPSDPVAPLAAWSLGDLLEKAGDRQGAVNAFAAYRALSPKGDFAEDALVRELRTAVERRKPDEARALAAQYEREFPEGARGEEVARWLAQLEGASELGADAGAPVSDSAESETEAAPDFEGEAP